MKSKLNLVIFFFLFFNINHANSQSGFIFQHSGQFDENPSAIVQTADAGYIVTAGLHVNDVVTFTILFRLTSSGDTVCSRFLDNPGGQCSMTDIIKLDNGNYMGLGCKTSSTGANSLWLLTFSDSLTILSDTSFSTLFKYTFDCFGFIDHFLNLIVYGCASDTAFGPLNIFVYQFSQGSNLNIFNYYKSSRNQIPFSMIEKPDSSGYYVAYYGRYNVNTSSISQIMTMDYSYNVIRIDSVPRGLDFYLEMKSLNNHEFVLTGKKVFYNQTVRTDKLAILKLDTSFQIKAQNYIGPEDTISYPGYLTNMDFTHPNNIFYTGVANQSIGGHFPSYPSFILLGRFDSLLNMSFEKYYGGDLYYEVWCMNATSDGGCIIGATSYDWNTQNYKRNLYILKIDSNGLITGSNDQPVARIHEVILYPNPGCDQINVETQLKNSVFHLYDLTGKLIYSHELLPGRNTINVRNLHLGSYIYKVLQNSILKETGKWIKQ